MDMASLLAYLAFMLRIASCLLAALTLSPAAAFACSDAGPPNATCNPDGGAWIECATHDDCPGAQLCDHRNRCACGSGCPYGEACEGAACQCTGPERPDAGPECTATLDSCDVWTVRCPDAGVTSDMDGGASTDGGGSTPSSGGCSVAARAPRSLGWIGLVALAALGIRRTRRAR